MSVVKMKMLDRLMKVHSNHNKSGWFFPFSLSSAIRTTLEDRQKIYFGHSQMVQLPLCPRQILLFRAGEREVRRAALCSQFAAACSC